jgi:endonuclease/exonuclease/phosphatase family metal-dependent hydrolase
VSKETTVRVLTWNLFHGRSRPPAGRSLLGEFTAALDGWRWDVALLQEVPPWWAPLLARGCGASSRVALTSRNWLLPARRAVSARNPDLLKSNGAGANVILVRGPAPVAHRVQRLTWRPERRVAHGVRLPDGSWVVNLHATLKPKPQSHADVARTVRAARSWAGDAPLVVGGDFNLRHPELPGLERVASARIDHVYARGWTAATSGEVLDAGPLSDHRPLLVALTRPAAAETRSPDRS